MLWLLLGVWQKKSEKTGDAAGFAKKRQNEAIKTTTLAKAAVACFWLQAKSFAILLANPSPFRHPVHSASSSCATNQRTSVNDGLPWGFAATRSFHLEPSLLPSAAPPLSLSLSLSLSAAAQIQLLSSPPLCHLSRADVEKGGKMCTGRTFPVCTESIPPPHYLHALSLSKIPYTEIKAFSWGILSFHVRTLKHSFSFPSTRLLPSATGVRGGRRRVRKGDRPSDA